MNSRNAFTFGGRQWTSRFAAVLRHRSGQRWFRVPTLSVFLALVVLTAGCSTVVKKPEPTAKVGSISKGDERRAGKITPAELEAEVMRFGDELTALVAQAADDFAEQVGTPQARAQALRWKTEVADNTMIIATGANSTANLLDMVVFVTLGRMNSEDHWVPRCGPAAQPLLDVTRKLEQEIWTIAGRVLTPAQQDELRSMIRAWRAEHPGQVDASVRFRDFAGVAAKKERDAKGKPGSVFGFLFLDPFAGLDPATREMEQTRYVADRALYVIKRMPTLLRWESELFFAQALAAPDVQQFLTNSTVFVQTAQQLPEQLSAETRKVMNDFAAQTPQWQALLTQFQQSFQAGNEMAASVNAATKSLDAFVGRYASPRPTDQDEIPPTPSIASSGGESNAAPASAAKHFDVTEYGAAAAQIAAAAQQLNTLVGSMDKVTPQISATVERTGLQGKELVDYTFRRALWLVGVTLVGMVLALLVYRWLATRLFGNPPRQQ
jgi:hypothetical protein